MDNVVDIKSRENRSVVSGARVTTRTTGTSGGGGDGVDLEPRVREVEKNLHQLMGSITTLVPQLATKTDLSDSNSSMIRWMVGIAFASTTLLVAVIAIAMR